MTVTAIRLSDSGKGKEIKRGDSLICRSVYGGAGRRVTVSHTSERYIWIGETKYRRDGSMVGDEFRRCCLFVEKQIARRIP